MKREKLVTFLWSCLLSFLIGFSAVACLVTAFDMQVEQVALALWCAAASVACSACFTLPLSLLPVGAGALVCGYLWQQGSLELSIESLLYRLSRQYNRAYGWGLVRWTMRTADEMELTLALCLCALGMLIAMVTAWTVCRRKPAVISLLSGLIPLVACLVVTDTVPDAVWLYLFLLGLVTVLLTGTVRRQSGVQGNRACALAIGPAALLLLVLFLAVPQKDYTGQVNARRIADAFLRMEPVQSLIGQFTDVHITGVSVDGYGVDLTQAGVRYESRAEVMQVTADHTGTLYLRSRGLDAYDGLSWTDSGTDTSLLSWTPKGLSAAGEVRISTRYAHRMLYVPYYSRGTQIKEMAVGLENDTHLTQYSFPWFVEDEKAQQSYAFSEAGQMVTNGVSYSDAFTHLSEEARAWAEPLAQRLTQGVQGDHNKAQIIGNYVRQSADYDTNTQAMPRNQKDFARWFLEKSDTGYCVHFATAATVLLQAAGIPARYVTGYMTQVVEGKTTVVEARQAHAWTEYWLAGYGWVVLEATPAAPVEPTTDTQPGTEPSVSQDPTQEIPDGFITPEKPTDAPTTQPENRDDWFKALRICLYVAAGIGALLGQYILRRYLRKKRLSGGTVNQQAIARWFQAVRLARLLGEQPPSQLYQLAERARFSQHLLDDMELAPLDAYIGQAQGRLKKRSVFHRLWYRLVLALY